MTKKLFDAVKTQKENTEQSKLRIYGSLGIPLGGERLVEVPNRNSFVYVRLRDNQNEVIQAFNNKVSPAYNLPVIVEREGNRYIVVSVDTQRYQNNWNSFSSYLPRHGNTHSHNSAGGGGGDVVFVYDKQFMPLLSMPSGSDGGPNVILNGYTMRNELNNTWRYLGNTGTQSLLQYVPTGSNAVMVLVYLDLVTGNPGILVNSGSYFPNNITGTAEIVPYIPQISNPNFVPDSAIRLVTGTSVIGWDNIYDLRQFIKHNPTGTSMFIQSLGQPLGSAGTLNFIGEAGSVSISGSTARIVITGSAGGGSGGINTGTLDARYLKLNADNDPLTGTLQIIPTGSLRYAVYAESDGDFTVGDFEQYSGVNGNSTDPVVFLYRGRLSGGVNPFFTAPILKIWADDVPTGTNAGGLLQYQTNGTNIVTDINPHVTNTGTSAMFDTEFALSPNGLLLLLKNDGSPKFYVNASGTAFSNGEPLIKEAPFNSGTYGRKNNGWEPIIPQNGWNNFPGGLAFASSDSPSFVVTTPTNVTGTVGVGNKIQLTHQGQNKFFFVTSVSITGSTSYLNLYGGTDYDLNITGAITNPFYSQIKAPFGFPLDPDKWTVTTTNTNACSKSSPTVDTWYGDTALSATGPSINIPIGSWWVSYSALAQIVINLGAVGNVGVRLTLSTSSSSASDSNNTKDGLATLPISGTAQFRHTATLLPKIINAASKTTYYLDILTSQSATTISIAGGIQTTVIKAVCTYL